MLVKNTLMALMGLAVAAEATSIHHPASGLSRRQNRGGNKGNQGGNQAGGNAGNAGSTTLNANAIQTGSQSTGQQNGVAADGQVNSAT
jgi:transcription initiation factor TFIID subunit 15